MFSSRNRAIYLGEQNSLQAMASVAVSSFKRSHCDEGKTSGWGLKSLKLLTFILFWSSGRRTFLDESGLEEQRALWGWCGSGHLSRLAPFPAWGLALWKFPYWGRERTGLLPMWSYTIFCTVAAVFQLLETVKNMRSLFCYYKQLKCRWMMLGKGWGGAGMKGSYLFFLAMI